MAESLKNVTAQLSEHGAVNHILSLSIGQAVFQHGLLRLEVAYEGLFPDSQKLASEQIGGLIGQTLELDWGSKTYGDEKPFYGIVTGVQHEGLGKTPNRLELEVSAPTTLLSGEAYSQCHVDQSPNDIFSATCEQEQFNRFASKAKLTANSTLTDKLPLSMRVNETSWNYLRRLASSTGNLLYYEGDELVFGPPKKAPIKLGIADVEDFAVSFQCSPVQGRYSHFDYDQAKIEQKDHGKTPVPSAQSVSDYADLNRSIMGRPDQSGWVKPSLFPSERDKGGLEKKLDEARFDQHKPRLAQYTLTTSHPGIRVGMELTAEHILKDDGLIVMSIQHSVEGKQYQNILNAIPASCYGSATGNFRAPKVSSMVATVADHADPQQMGRIKVSFPWDADKQTPWLRMVTPSAGAGRGHYFVPEIGDEVVVAFEMDNIDAPFVTGPLYNGKGKFDRHYDAENNVKAISTRSGHEIIFDDGNKKLIIQNEKNSITLDFNSKGEIIINSDGPILINSGDTITMAAEKDIQLSAENIKLEAQQKVSAAGTEIDINGQQKAVMKSAAIEVSSSAGGTKIDSKTKVDIKSTAATTVESSGMTTIKGLMVKLN